MARAGLWRKLGFLALTLGALAACRGNNRVLPGERVAIRPQMQVENVAAPIALGRAVSNANWEQEGFDSHHLVPHLALAARPGLRWRADIGRGNSDRSRITASPVVAGGVIFTLDAGGQVQASNSANGAMLWRADITPIDDSSGAEGFGGGLAVDGNSLYVTTGFGELLSLSTQTGTVNWRYRFDAPLRGGPTVAAGRVFVMAANDVAYAIDGARGKLSWSLRNARASGPVAMGGANPAVAGQNVVLPYSSGRNSGATTGGTLRWDIDVNRARLSDVRATIGGFPGAPVILGGRVFAANAGGELAAMRLTNGTTIWSVPVGATDKLAVIGGAVFLMSDTSQLLRIDAATGRVLWATQLPEYTKPKKRRGFIAHYGPVVAGGQVVVAGTDGQLRFFDPVSGAATYSTALPGGAASSPIVASGVLYVVNKKGQLLAFQ